jgi:hypothetical protein
VACGLLLSSSLFSFVSIFVFGIRNSTAWPERGPPIAKIPFF